MLRTTWWVGLVALALAGASGCERYHEHWCEDHGYYRRDPYRGGGCPPGCAPSCPPGCAPTTTGFAPPATNGCYP